MYSRLSEEAAKDYDKVKIALMKRYDLTEDGYRRKFRASKPEADESPEQFIVRLDRYLLRWLELSDTEQTFGGLKDLSVIVWESVPEVENEGRPIFMKLAPEVGLIQIFQMPSWFCSLTFSSKVTGGPI